MRTNQTPNGIEPEVWATYRMIEKVFTLALRDARQGKPDAIEFLDLTAPDWKERTQRKHKGKAST